MLLYDLNKFTNPKFKTMLRMININVVILTVRTAFGVLYAACIRAHDGIMLGSTTVQNIELIPLFPVLLEQERFFEEKFPVDLHRITGLLRYDRFYNEVPRKFQRIPVKWQFPLPQSRPIRIHRSPRGAHFHG